MMAILKLRLTGTTGAESAIMMADVGTCHRRRLTIMRLRWAVICLGGNTKFFRETGKGGENERANKKNRMRELPEFNHGKDTSYTWKHLCRYLQKVRSRIHYNKTKERFSVSFNHSRKLTRYGEQHDN